MIILSVILLVSAFLFAYEEYCEYMLTVDYDRKEHWASIAHRFSLLVFGYAFAKLGEVDEILLYLGLYWLCTDGFMNLLKRRNFFAVSSQSGNPFEKWNIVKYTLLTLGIGILIWKII